MRCFCGTDKWVGESQVDGFHGTDPCKLTLVECGECGSVRQITTPPDYTDEYHDRYWAHTYENDREVAKLRLGVYGEASGSKIVDVGSNNGAFVDEARARGYKAWGVEPGAEKLELKEKHTYASFLEDVAFPCEFANLVTLHDVLEHVEDPLALLTEVRRITARDGRAIIDVPAFWSGHGKKHWKKHEHIWFFGEKDMKRLAHEAGFSVADCQTPIPGKSVYYLKPLPYPEDEPTIVLPDGIGDIYWAMTKVGGLIEEKGWKTPVRTQLWRATKAGRRNRAVDYLRRDPRLRYDGLGQIERGDRRMIMRNNGNPCWELQPNKFHFIVNGPLTPKRSQRKVKARPLSEIFPEYPVEWYPKLFRSLEFEAVLEQTKWAEDRYCAYVNGAGGCTHGSIDGPMAVVRIAETLYQKTGRRTVLLGAKSDLKDWRTRTVARAEHVDSMVGKTTLDEALAIMINAKGTVGTPSGLTIVGAAEGAKVACMWSRLFQKPFWHNMVPPDADYAPFDAAGEDYPIEEAERMIVNWLVR